MTKRLKSNVQSLETMNNKQFDYKKFLNVGKQKEVVKDE